MILGSDEGPQGPQMCSSRSPWSRCYITIRQCRWRHEYRWRQHEFNYPESSYKKCGCVGVCCIVYVLWWGPQGLQICSPESFRLCNIDSWAGVGMGFNWGCHNMNLTIQYLARKHATAWGVFWVVSWLGLLALNVWFWVPWDKWDRPMRNVHRYELRLPQLMAISLVLLWTNPTKSWNN